MIEKEKIAEYLLNYYKLIEYASRNKNIEIHTLFDELYYKGLISIDKDEYNDMILTYFYFCIIKVFSFCKDSLYKGINEKDLDNIFIDDEIEENKKALENFSKKDIILFIRNALAHSNGDNQLYSFEKNDKGEIVIRISLKKAKASIGENKGKIIPFDLILDFGSLLLFCHILRHESKTPHILGITCSSSSAKEMLKNIKNPNTLLNKLLDETYYYRDFYNTISEKDKNVIYNLDKNNFYYQFTTFLEPKKSITKTKKLSIVQKNTFLSNIKKWSGTNIKLELFELYDYEASKIIPIGLGKTDVLYISAFKSLLLINKLNYHMVSSQVIDGLLGNKEHPYNNFSNLFMDRDNLMERIKYGALDSNNDNNLALSLFMGYMLENIISDEKVVIENKEYPRHRLRNAFVHGRWYVSDKKWELFDWKKDEFNIEWHKSINISSMRDAMIDYLDSYIKNKKNIR